MVNYVWYMFVSFGWLFFQYSLENTRCCLERQERERPWLENEVRGWLVAFAGVAFFLIYSCSCLLFLVVFGCFWVFILYHYHHYYYVLLWLLIIIIVVLLLLLLTLLCLCGLCFWTIFFSLTRKGLGLWRTMGLKQIQVLFYCPMLWISWVCLPVDVSISGITTRPCRDYWTIRSEFLKQIPNTSSYSSTSIYIERERFFLISLSFVSAFPLFRIVFLCFCCSSCSSRCSFLSLEVQCPELQDLNQILSGKSTSPLSFCS